MSRFLFFLATIIIPTIFSWWLFIPLAFLFVYFAKLPYEIILAGFLLDLVYYFGEGIWYQYPLTLFSVLLIAGAWFLNGKINWQKTI
jgi:hypothetical protein